MLGNTIMQQPNSQIALTNGRIVLPHEIVTGKALVVDGNKILGLAQGLEEQELAWFRGFRWWRLEELANSTERTSPDTLPAVLRRVAEFVRSAS